MLKMKLGHERQIFWHGWSKTRGMYWRLAGFAGMHRSLAHGMHLIFADDAMDKK